MQVYIAPRQSNVNSMTLIDPEHSSWDQIKLLLAAKAYPDDIVPCASDVRVYLSPYDQNLEQDGVENAIKFLPAHCVVRVEIVSPSILNSREARTPSITSESTGSSSSSASSVSEEEEPEPRNHLREQIDKIVVGYAMTAQNDYKNRLVTIRNQFLDSKLIERRQFDLVNHDEATCMLCPVALRPDPSSDVAKLQDHARTRWHMRYLTFVKDQDAVFRVSLALQEQFESELAREQRADSSLQRVRDLKAQQHVLQYGHQVSYVESREEMNRKVTLVQTIVRQMLAKRSAMALKARLKAIEEEKKEKYKKNNEFLWNSIAKELCKHCTRFQSCKLHNAFD